MYPAPGFTFGVNGGRQEAREAHLCCGECRPLVDAADWPALVDRAAGYWLAEYPGAAAVHARSELLTRFHKLAGYLQPAVPILLDVEEVA